MHALLQLYLTLCDPMESSPPGFPLHGILQARILEWVAISFSIKLVYLTVISSKHSDQTTLAILAERINTQLKKLESNTNIKINVTFLKKKHRWNFIKNISFSIYRYSNKGHLLQFSQHTQSPCCYGWKRCYAGVFQGRHALMQPQILG